MNNNIYRSRTDQVLKDLEKKMVFIIGPRQVGKTHLAKEIAKNFQNVEYLNYDNIEDKKEIKEMQWSKNTDLLILDELHKMNNWKNFLKGLYDTKEDKLCILVTGSARLEAYRRIGDSMAGRFFSHCLMPLSLSELKNTSYQKDIDYFMQRGGFPEPFLAQDDSDAERWRKDYIDSLTKGDVLSFEKIHDVNLMENIFEILRRKVGSPISYSSIARDVEASSATVKKYIEILESLYIIFKVYTYSKKIARSILKEIKVYFFDVPLVVGDDGLKFENFMALSLLENNLQRNDLLGQRNKLMYLRDKEHREVDFAIINSDNDVEKIIEVKLSDNTLSRNLKYFKNKYNFKAEQIVKNLRHEKEIDGIKILRAEEYFLK